MKRSVLCLLSSLSVLSLSAAESNSGLALTNAAVHSIDSLSAEVLRSNPEIDFYRAEIAAARAGLKTAGTLANPDFSTQLGYKGVRDKTGMLLGEGVAWSVSLAQPFEWPGRIGLRKAIANRDIELAELGLARFTNALAGRVRVLAYNLAAAQEQAVVVREVAERFQALREVLVQRDPAGITPLLETRVIEATELPLHRRAADAVLLAKTALLEINQLRGLPPESPLTIARTRLAFRPIDDLEALLALARTNNFELRLRMVELAQQGLRVDLAKNEKRPGFAVGPYVSLDRAGDREAQAGISFSMPLPWWNKNAGNISAAQARQLQADTALFVARREIDRQVTANAITYQAKLAGMARWRPDAIEHFREAAEIADRHYRLGAVPVSTYVELQKQYLEAVEGLLDTKKEALAAALELEILTGLSLPLADMNMTEDGK